MKYFKAGIMALLLCLIASLQGSTVYGDTQNGFYYYVIDYEDIPYAMIQSYTGSEEHLVIPEELGGYPVKDVSLWASEDDDGEINTTTKTITIPASVEEFSVHDFMALTDIYVDEGNKAYQSVDGVLYSKDGTILVRCPDGRKGRFEIKEGTVDVWDSAFSDGMTELYIPESFENVENLVDALYSPYLEKIEISDKNTSMKVSNDIIYNKDGTELLKCPIGKKGSIDIPDGVEIIKSNAFFRCGGIDKVTMPDTVVSVGEWAFGVCSSLTDIRLSENITSIGDGVFYGCLLLNRLVIPKNVESVSPTAFSYGIKELVIEDGNENLIFADGLLYGEKGKLLIKCLPAVAGEVNLQEGVVTIQSVAFYGCSSVTKITMPDSVTNMGEDAFGECISLEEIHLSNNLTNISINAFSGCMALREIVIPESVTVIEDCAFQGCLNLTDVWIESAKVEYIGYYLFSQYGGRLTQVHVYDEKVYNMFMENEGINSGIKVTLVKKTEPLELSRYSVTLYTGNVKKSATVKAVLTDIKGTVKWSTSDKSVATVKNGKIMAVKKGKAVCTAKVGKYKKTVNVTVKNPSITVIDGSESINSVTVKKGSTAYYRVNVNPKGSKMKVEVGKDSRKTAKITLKSNILAVKGMKKGKIKFKIKCGLGSKNIVVRVK